MYITLYFIVGFILGIIITYLMSKTNTYNNDVCALMGLLSIVAWPIVLLILVFDYIAELGSNRGKS